MARPGHGRICGSCALAGLTDPLRDACTGSRDHGVLVSAVEVFASGFDARRRCRLDRKASGCVGIDDVLLTGTLPLTRVVPAADERTVALRAAVSLWAAGVRRAGWIERESPAAFCGAPKSWL